MCFSILYCSGKPIYPKNIVAYYIVTYYIVSYGIFVIFNTIKTFSTEYFPKNSKIQIIIENPNSIQNGVIFRFSYYKVTFGVYKIIFIL